MIRAAWMRDRAVSPDFRIPAMLHGATRFRRLLGRTGCQAL